MKSLVDPLREKSLVCLSDGGSKALPGLGWGVVRAISFALNRCFVFSLVLSLTPPEVILPPPVHSVISGYSVHLHRIH